MKHLKDIVFLGLVGVIVFISTYALAEEELPVLKDVGVDADISYDKSTGVYNFSYSVSNPSSNTGEVSLFRMEIAKAEGTASLSSEGLFIKKVITRKGNLLIKSFDDALAVKSAWIEGDVIPVGTDFPGVWSSALRISREVRWGAGHVDNAVKPGNSLKGFELYSRGIPGIRNIVVEPHWVYIFKGSISDEETKRADEIEEKLAFYGKAVGPVAPPAEFDALVFIDYIIKLKHDAIELGWVNKKGGQGIIRSLDAKLNSAKRAIERSNILTAKNILGAFLNEVEAQGCSSYKDCNKGKHLKPEAYALLKYNVEYLLSKL